MWCCSRISLKGTLQIVAALVFSASMVLAPLAYAETAARAKKKPGSKQKPPAISPREIFTVNVSYTTKKGEGVRAVDCYKGSAGQARSARGTLTFVPLSKELTGLRTLLKKARTKKAKKKAKEKITILQSVMSSARELCTEEEHLSLLEYRGEFGPAEARLLYDRFAFGATPEAISAAVAAGFDATVNQLLTAQAEPTMDAIEAELRCDGYLPNDSRDETRDPEKCPPGNRNAIRFSGVRFSIYERFWNTSNPFFERLFFFLHDERMAAGSQVLSSCDAYALVDHVNLLRRAAYSGNYKQFMRDWNNDYLGHLVWLDGASNSGERPNENYAREFWELGTVGPTGLDQIPVYSDFDIAQAALAFSGWTREYDEFTDGLGEEYGVCYGARAPLKHAPGPKRIFAGTPWEAVVENDEDMVTATFAHPRTAEHLAEDIWKQFISPYATPGAIQKLASVIRDSDYNLHTVFRRVMRSRALFAAKSRKSLIKHPTELAFGFLRSTGVPILSSLYTDNGQEKTSANQYENLEWYVLDSLSQKVLQPPTVFGWDEKRLAAELYVIPWRSALAMLVSQDAATLMTRHGFSFTQRFAAGIPTGESAALALVDRLAQWFNIELTDAQKSHLTTYLNNEYVRCSTSEKNDPTMGCDGSGNRLKRDLYDPHPAADSRYEVRLRGTIAALLGLPQYRVK
jgi:uncharacterized protein (DUF1800 family)